MMLYFSGLASIARRGKKFFALNCVCVWLVGWGKKSFARTVCVYSYFSNNCATPLRKRQARRYF
ncbi:MAG: hypothetical protein LBO71_07455 [Prevotellaceae bacterium]|nr:hypothetical protein [Prevotellaceae bacterium]